MASCSAITPGVSPSGPATTSHVYISGGTFEPTVTPVDADGTRGATRALDEVTVLVDPVAKATATPRCAAAPGASGGQ